MCARWMRHHIPTHSLIGFGYEADSQSQENMNMSGFRRGVVLACLAIACIVSTCPLVSYAQLITTGNNGVYTGSSCCTPVQSFIDISVSVHLDICQTINDVITGTSPFPPFQSTAP
jgi:hypothetical protein